MTDTPDWYATLYEDYCTDEGLADFQHEGPRIRYPARRYDVSAAIDAILDGHFAHHNARKEAA